SPNDPAVRFLLRVLGEHFDLWQPPSNERESKPTAGLATLNGLAGRTAEDEYFPSSRTTNDQRRTTDVLRNRSRADVRVGPRADADAVPQVRSGTHARAAGGAGTSGKSLSNCAGRRHQWQGFHRRYSRVHPASFRAEDGALYFASSGSHQ